LRLRRPSEAVLPGKEFPDQTSDISDESHHSGHARPTGKDCPCVDTEFEARSPDFDVAAGLLWSLDNVSSPNYLAQEAAQDESAYALDIPERLTDYIRQV
jgi:hypothetical protein